MEGPLEVKHSTPGTEEPIKSEVPVQSPGSSDRSDAVSPPPNCSICLGKLVNTSFTDSCLHQFCFACLLQWSKIKTECPLCKQTFKSIIHNVRSEEDYDQYHVPRDLASQIPQPPAVGTLDLNITSDRYWDGIHEVLYRSMMESRRQRYNRIPVLLNPEQVARREQLPSVAPQVPRDERRRRRANPTDYRRTIYRLGVWATSLPDVFGRFRECSADYYRREPRELNRLIPWLDRELQVLLSNNSHIAYVMRIILEALRQYDIRSSEFRDLVRPYFGIRTDHFVHELLNYARTNFDLVGYDQSVTYLPQGLSNEYVSNVVSPTSSSSSSSSSSSDDSEVRVLDEAIDLRVNTEIPSVGPHPINPLRSPFGDSGLFWCMAAGSRPQRDNMPGPSTVAQAFQVDMPYNPPDVFIISSNSSSSDDDCEVIGYVKPRHERTPEIIELISSDEDINTSQIPNDNVQHSAQNYLVDMFQPSTSSNVKRAPAFSWNDSNSDSDCTCKRSRRYQTRGRKAKRNTTGKRRNQSIETKSRNRGTRNSSSSGESGSRKRGNKRCTQHDIKKKLSSSSDYSSDETLETEKIEEKTTRKRQYASGPFTSSRKEVNKRLERHTQDDSYSSDSSSSTDGDTKSDKSYTVQKSKRKYVSSSSDSDKDKSERVTRTRCKTRQPLDTVVASKESDGKETRYKENKQSRSRSTSGSSYSSEKEKRTYSRRREAPRELNEYGSHNDSNSTTRDLTRKEHESKSKSRSKKFVQNSSDTGDGPSRSNSQCSDRSSKTHAHWKKSKHKDRHKSKERKRSISRTYNSSLSISDTFDGKNTSTNKDRRKSRKSHKESKRRRSQSDTKSKSKKKRRRVRSSTSSQSE